MENFTRELESTRKNQMELLELLNAKIEIKNALD